MTELSIRESESLISGSESSISGSESTTDLADEELIQRCTRGDLFALLKEDPKYYLTLIKENNLEHQLDVFISRSEHGNCLHIKFRIYPEDRWTEVGYWGESEDEDVYLDFVDQIKILMQRSRKGPKYDHLSSQLDGNNNVLSPDYMKKDDSSVQDIEKLNKLRSEPPPQFEFGYTKSKPVLQVKNQQLAQFKTILIEKIVNQIPKLINVDKDVSVLLAKLKQISKVPESFSTHYQKMIDKLESMIYIRELSTLLKEEQDMYGFLVKAHRISISQNPDLYLNLDLSDVPLELDETKILEIYSLTLSDIWISYLKSIQ